METSESTQSAPSPTADGVQEQNRKVLIDHFLKLLGEICRERGLLPGDIFTGRRKDRGLSRAREDLAIKLRDTVGYAKGVTPREYAVFSNGLDQFTHEPISYPVMGRLFGMNHTTLILACRRARNRNASEEGQEKSHGKEAVVG